MVYGQSKIGKTTLVLNLVEPYLGKSTKEGPVCYLISADRGTKKIHLAGDRYEGRIAIAYPNTLAEWRETVKELGVRINKVAKFKSAKDIWIVLDTVTHMQNQLLTESRAIDVKSFSPKRNKGNRGKADDVFVRDATTQVDWNINLTHMGELTNSLLKLPANVLTIALEKEGRDSAGRATYGPALSGQSREKIVGDADIVARMMVHPKDGDKRVLLVGTGNGSVAGDRTGKLKRLIPARLSYLQEKIFEQAPEPLAIEVVESTEAIGDTTGDTTGDATGVVTEEVTEPVNEAVRVVPEVVTETVTETQTK